VSNIRVYVNVISESEFAEQESGLGLLVCKGACREGSILLSQVLSQVLLQLLSLLQVLQLTLLNSLDSLSNFLQETLLQSISRGVKHTIIPGGHDVVQID
jgi:hypothetical protein